MHRLTIAALALLSSAPAFAAEPLLNPVFGDHAVLQRDQPIHIWGTATPNAAVTVTLSSDTTKAHADSSGHWSAELPPLHAGGPYTLTAKTDSGTSETLNDILVGDVYLCSGQSNMAFPTMLAIDAGPDIQVSANDSIRLMSVADVTSLSPLSQFPKPVTWAAAGPKTVPNFSAACYFFGRDLQKSEHVPLGLINDSWPGAGIQTFMSEGALYRAGGEDSRIKALNLYARDKTAGMKHWGDLIEDFWHNNGQTPWSNPVVSAKWPLAPKGLGIWTTWGVKSLENYAGDVWFRTSVKLTAAEAAQPAEISLGTVTEEDQTWINGHFIASTFGYGQSRQYALPAGTLHAGVNDILVNDYCGWKGCGLFGPPQARAIKFKDGTSVPLDGAWHYRQEAGVNPPRVPWGATAGVSVAYNAMIAPLAPYTLKGVLWYQGESNTGAPDAYQGLLKAWMADWRELFQKPNLPYLIVQLPDYGLPPFKPEESNWARLRESQRLAVADDPHAALAVTIDIGDHGGLHPANKQEVGRRLSLAARRLIYHDASIKSGPTPATIALGRGSVTVRFNGVNGRLKAVDGAQPIGFELCGPTEKTCHFVSARIRGDAVTLAVPRGLRPTRVRYCWADGPVCTLYDATRIPAVPFEFKLPAVAPHRAHRHK